MLKIRLCHILYTDLKSTRHDYGSGPSKGQVFFFRAKEKIREKSQGQINWRQERDKAPQDYIDESLFGHPENVGMHELVKDRAYTTSKTDIYFVNNKKNGVEINAARNIRIPAKASNGLSLKAFIIYE